MWIRSSFSVARLGQRSEIESFVRWSLSGHFKEQKLVNAPSHNDSHLLCSKAWIWQPYEYNMSTACVRNVINLDRMSSLRHDDCTMVLLNEKRALAAVLLLFVSSSIILSAVMITRFLCSFFSTVFWMNEFIFSEWPWALTQTKRFKAVFSKTEWNTVRCNGDFSNCKKKTHQKLYPFFFTLSLCANECLADIHWSCLAQYADGNFDLHNWLETVIILGKPSFMLLVYANIRRQKELPFFEFLDLSCDEISFQYLSWPPLK